MPRIGLYPGVPDRQRLGLSLFRYYESPTEPPAPPTSEFEGHLFPSWRWFWEMEEGEQDTVGLFWTHVLDHPARAGLRDRFPDRPRDLLYDVEDDQWFKIVMVERQRPRPDWDRGYLLRLSNDSTPGEDPGPIAPPCGWPCSQVPTRWSVTMNVEKTASYPPHHPYEPDDLSWINTTHIITLIPNACAWTKFQWTPIAGTGPLGTGVPAISMQLSWSYFENAWEFIFVYGPPGLGVNMLSTAIWRTPSADWHCLGANQMALHRQTASLVANTLAQITISPFQ